MGLIEAARLIPREAAFRSVELYLKICPTDEALRELDKCDLPERAKIRERLVRDDRYGAIEAMGAAMGLRR